MKIGYMVRGAGLKNFTLFTNKQALLKHLEPFVAGHPDDKNTVKCLLVEPFEPQTKCPIILWATSTVIYPCEML